MRKMTPLMAAGVCAALCLGPSWSQGAPPHFLADGGIEGSSLEGWTKIGEADWTVRDGVVTGRSKSSAGGWLLLEKEFANVGFYSRILCPDACKGGVMLRAEKTSDGGLKGIYIAFSDSERGIYALVTDSNGREISRTKLQEGRSLGGLPNTLANTPPEILELMKKRSEELPNIRLPDGVTLPPMMDVSGEYVKGEWNSLNVYLFQDALNPSVNGAPVGVGALPQSILSDEDSRYGGIALHVAGRTEAKFDDVLYKDLLVRKRPREQLSADFEMRRLDGLFYSWSPAVADFNQDGHPDIAAGPWIYFGPDYETVREYYTPVAYNPTEDYPQLSTVALSADFTGDGWPDIIQFTGNAGFITGILYVNPQGESRPWDSHQVLDLLANEETLLKDIDGDGVPEVIHGGPDYRLGYSKPDPENPTGKWITTVIAEPGPWGDFLVHGLGVGDINGDGRNDFLSPFGWWEQPAAGNQGLWKYHPFAFGRRGISQGNGGGAQLGVWDVNGDGLNDVVTPLEGHGFGLAWYEQKRSGDGEITFVQHMIMDNYYDRNAGELIFTQPHAAEYADMNGDGLLDIVTGKRAFSHLTSFSDPDPYGPAVVVVYTSVRDKDAPGGARFVPHLVHNFSGVGAHITLEDVNGDGRPDIQTSGPYGTFLFINRMKQ